MTYWYLFETWFCPVCGRERTEKQRVTDRPRPIEHAGRHVWHEHYDWCDV